MELMSLNSKKAVEILKLESQVSSQAEELKTFRNQSFTSEHTQVTKNIHNDNQSICSFNSDIISN